MKDSEDEAFDELARRQGDWGGGYQAKRKAVMDKISADFDEEYVKYRTAFPKEYTAPQSAQEQCQKHGECFGGECIYPPAQEPVAYVTGVYGGRFTYAPLNPAMVLPIGMALYAGPPQREWAGLTDGEMRDCLNGLPTQTIDVYARRIEAKIKERNHG